MARAQNSLRGRPRRGEISLMAAKPHPASHGFQWTPLTGPFRRLSAEEARGFDEHGFLLWRQLIPAGEAQAIALEVARLGAEAERRRLPHEILFSDGDKTVYVLRLSERVPRVRQLCLSPLFLDLAADLLGPDVWMNYSHTITKR